MNRRDFLGLVAAISACGLPAPPRKRPESVPTSDGRPRSGSEEWIRACLRDAVAVEVMEEVSLGGPVTTRITYVKQESGAAERCVFTEARKRAEMGRARYVAVEQSPLEDPFEISLSRPFGRRKTKTKVETRLVVEWVNA